MLRFKLTFCLLAIACLSDAASSPQLCGQQKISGGLIWKSNASQPGQFPWAGVMLWKDTMKPFCGCSLITNEYAITASHCLHEKNIETATSMSSVLVQFGRNDLSDDDEKGFVTRSIIDLTLHEDWDPFYDDLYDADIAIIRFNQTVSFSRRIQPICMPMAGEDIHKNGTVVSNQKIFFMISDNRLLQVGWGIFDETGATSQKQLFAQIDAVDNDECQEIYPETVAYITSDRTYCGGKPNSGINPCSGDSGKYT